MAAADYCRIAFGAAGADAAAHWDLPTYRLGSTVYYDCQSEDVLSPSPLGLLHAAFQLHVHRPGF